MQTETGTPTQELLQAQHVLDRCLRVRLDEHGTDHNSAMFQHLHSCDAFKFLLSLNNLPDSTNNKAGSVNFNSHVHQTVLNNVNIIATNTNFNQF